MWGRAILLVLPTALLTIAAEDDPLQIGKSFNIFATNPSLNLKLLSRNGSDSVFLQPTLDIFDDLGEPSLRHQRFAKSQAFHGNLTVEFCANVDQLLQGYFGDFRFEGLKTPWKVFTASWSRENVARYMGMHSYFMDDGRYGYVLVRVSRFADDADLSDFSGGFSLSEAVIEEIERIEVGDVHSVVKFIQEFGTHYVKSFVKGDSLYQVMVYKKDVFYHMLERFKDRGADLPTYAIGTYFSPWFAEHIGSIKTSSGNAMIESWASSKLLVHHYVFTYVNLLKARNDTNLLKYLNGLLKNEAVLKMDMRMVASVLTDQIKRKWFVEVLDNYLELWESNA